MSLIENFLYRLFVKPIVKRLKFKRDNILILDMEFIGDSVMVLPMINSLKQNNRVEKVDVLCYEQQKDVFERCPDVDDVVIIRSISELKNKSFIPGLGKDVYKLFYAWYVAIFIVPKIVNRYNVLMCPRSDRGSQSYMEIVALLCGIEKRYGYSWKNISNKVKNRREDCFTHLVYSSGKYIWPYESVLEFVELCGYQRYQGQVKLVHSGKNEKILSFGRYVVFAMDTTNNMREWPVEKFCSLGERFSLSGYTIVLVGTKVKYGQLYVQMSKNQKVINLVRKTTIAEAIDIIANADYYVGGDTGLSHIAGAVGCLGVVLFPHPEGCSLQINGIPQTCRPSGNMRCLQPKVSLPPCKEYCCSSDKAHCITNISVDEVWQEVVKDI